MTPLFAYLLKVIACSGILYSYYWIALRNNVFHSWNRFYLMGTMVISMLLPLIEVNIITPISSNSQLITAMQVVAGADEYVTEIQENASLTWDTTFVLNTLYVLISIAITIWLLMGISKIIKMIRRYPKQHMNDVLFLNTREPGTPFSFFRYLFWNEAIDPYSLNGQKMLEHELVHIREKHSHDKLFVHFVLSIYWANPFFWLIRKELAMVHEFIADQKTVTDTESFAQLILSASFPGHANLLTNAFFQSSIKRRITMITKNKNPRFTYISRLLLIPVLFVLIFTFAVKAEEIFYKENKRNSVNNGSAQISISDTTPSKKKIKSVTITYDDNSKEVLTEEQYKKRNQIKEVKIVKGDYIFLPSENIQKDSSVDSLVMKHIDKKVFIYGEEFSIDKMPLEIRDIRTINIQKNNGVEEIHINSKEKAGAKEITLVGHSTSGEKFEGKSQMDSGSVKEVIVFGHPKQSTTAENGSVKISMGYTKTAVDVLYVVDGKVTSKEDVKNLDQNKIKAINILKGESGISLYGDKGKNGVIMITLKN